jgi:hypothetical protein
MKLQEQWADSCFYYLYGVYFDVAANYSTSRHVGLLTPLTPLHLLLPLIYTEAVLTMVKEVYLL